MGASRPVQRKPVSIALYPSPSTPYSLAHTHTISFLSVCSLPFPPGVATLQELKLHIEGSKLTVVAKIKLLDMLAELDLVSSLSAESDIRIRETCAPSSPLHQ